MKNRRFFTLLRLLGLIIISLFLLVGSQCRFGKNYIAVAASSSKESAILEAQSYQKRGLDAQVFQRPDGSFVVTIGPYSSIKLAESDKNKKIGAKVIPSDAFVIDNIQNFSQIYPEPTTGIPRPPNRNPDTPPPGVRDEVKKDKESGMKDDFVVYPEN